jgi:ribosomal 30S subunit maturation factor RimM
VRYGRIDILKVVCENKAAINIEDVDLLDELSTEESVNIALDEEEINSIDDDNIYYDPIGMKVIWNDEDVAVIKDFFFNGAHYVYEIELPDASLVMIPDVESFVIETNIEKRFIRVVDLDQFISIING